MNFADRYARAGLKPTQDIISTREISTARVIKSLSTLKIFSLVEFCFGCSPGDIGWLINEYHKDDNSFSAYGNQQECVFLASTILSKEIADDNGIAILAVIAASLQRKRVPTGIEWLVDDAQEQLTHSAISNRRKENVEKRIKLAVTPKLAEDIAAVTVNDWAALLAKLSAVRTEAIVSSETIAVAVSNALEALDNNTKYMREESQILWWLFGEHSRTLDRPFVSMSAAQLSIVAGIELGELSTASVLGPVAAPAIINRVINSARKDKGPQKVSSLSTVIDSLKPDDLSRFTIREHHPPGIFPIMTAIAKAKENGQGSWQSVFGRLTGLDPQIEISPSLLSLQIYYEHLLGQIK